MSGALDRLAAAAGIEPIYHSYFGDEIHTPASTSRALLTAMGFDAASETSAQAALREIEHREAAAALPPVIVVTRGQNAALPNLDLQIALESGEPYAGAVGDLPLGYHCLRAADGRNERQCPLIVVPPQCYLLPAMRAGRIWALSTQLYALRSQSNWGIGDFRDLQTFGEIAAQAGAGAIGVNPLHELHPSDPAAASPYSPSSRLFLNVLYINVEQAARSCSVPEIEAGIADPAFMRRLEILRDGALVDYRGVAATKLDVLARIHRTVRARRDRHVAAFRRFVRRSGPALERLATYEALDEYFRDESRGLHDWQHWPPAYRAPNDPEVARFARAHRERVDLYLFLQWLAHEQLAAAATACRRLGTTFYRDLAVGADRNGADAWADQEAFVSSAALGAPPDPLNALGQNWGLPPLSPLVLRERAYAPFVALLRANMRHAGILRFDHVLSLQRAFWIPCGMEAKHGAYVRYPLNEMLGILALESVRNRCAVVGEDLGTVPDGFRERLHAAGVLSTRVLYFERDWNQRTFLPPQRYPRLAAASVGTHDLPTLAGWWAGADVELRREIALYPTPDAGVRAGAERAAERVALVDAFQRADALDTYAAARLHDDAARGGSPGAAAELAVAAERFLASTPSLLVTLAIEDVLGEPEAINIPGTIHEHPNWQRKRSVLLENLRVDERLRQAGRIVGNARFNRR